MGSIFDYLSWRGDLTLEQSPFNPVDNVILTHLSYLPLGGIVPRPEDRHKTITIDSAAKLVDYASKSETHGLDGHIMLKEDSALLEALGSSSRYKNMELTGFINKIDPTEEKQFAALTIITGDKHIFVTYRGTDDTLVGWKEDFKLAFNDVLPSQLEAVQYLETMASLFKKPVRTGGHSKGGNLAVYAASFCSKKIKRRITEIYLNDAPGFSSKVISSEGYKAIREKIVSFVPESSVVGMLFEHDYHNTVVKSSKNGLLQHNVYTWEVMGDSLIHVEGVDRESVFFNKTVKEFMASLDEDQFKVFTEVLFTVLGSTEISSFPELGTDSLKKIRTMVHSFRSIDPNLRGMFVKVLHSLFLAAKNNFRILIE